MNTWTKKYVVNSTKQNLNIPRLIDKLPIILCNAIPNSNTAQYLGMNVDERSK